VSDTAVVRLRDGAELWTAVSGSGPPAVLLHGGPGLWDYLADLAAMLDGQFTVVRFDQRGCGRSTGHDGPFTIAQAVDDLDQVRAAHGFSRWAVAGHSWGAELALRYAARHQARAAAVAYIAGVGAGNAYKEPHVAELARRLGPDHERWAALSALPGGARTPAEEREMCLLQWRTDFSPGPGAAGHALAMWETRPPGAVINTAANRELWHDRHTEDLLEAAARVTCRVTMISGDDDPRPWTATDSLLEALPDANRAVVAGAGHAPWAERPDDTRRLIAGALRAGELPRRAADRSPEPVGFPRGQAFPVHLDLVVDRLEVLLHLRQLGEHVGPVGFQESEPLVLVARPGGDQLRVAADARDGHAGGAQLGADDDPLEVESPVPAAPAARPVDRAGDQAGALVVAERVRAHAGAAGRLGDRHAAGRHGIVVLLPPGGPGR
jgi:proline iminopeptidase